MSDRESSDSPGPASRREFLTRCVKAGVTLAAAGGAAAWLINRPEWGEAGETVSLGDYRVDGMAGKMRVVKGGDRPIMLQRGLEAMGGLAKFISPGQRVLIKVNAAFASPPSLGATTNPELAGELVRLCLAVGAKEVIVTDNPINNPGECFTLTGIGKAVTAAGGRVVLPKDHFFRPTTVEGGRRICNWPLLYDPFENVDRVIGVAPAKDHNLSGASMTMKNWYGLLGGRRNQLHQDIHGTIMELAMMVRPTLVILDGTETMMANGPTGGSLDDLKATRRMVISTDHVAADAYGVTQLLGRWLGDVPYINKAAEAGAGTADYESLDLDYVTVA